MEDEDPHLSPEEIAALAALELADDHSDAAAAVARRRIQEDVEAYQAKMSQWWRVDRSMQREEQQSTQQKLRRQPVELTQAEQDEILRRLNEDDELHDDDDDEGDEDGEASYGAQDEAQDGQGGSVGERGATEHRSPSKKTLSAAKVGGKAKGISKSSTASIGSTKKATTTSNKTKTTSSPSRRRHESSTNGVTATGIVNKPNAPAAMTKENRYHSHSKPLRADYSHQRGTGSGGYLPPPCTLHDLVRAVLAPELRVGGSDAIADGLAQVKIAELQDMNVTTSTLFEMLGNNLTHLYAQHNALSELAGLQLCPKLSVVVVNHNKLSTLEELRDMDSITIIDASYNQIAELDPARHLPCSNLKSLNLQGNPCCPAYDAHDADDVAYVAEYRRAILKACEKISMLDGVPVTAEMRIELGLEDTVLAGGGGAEPLLVEMARHDRESVSQDAELERETGLQTTVTDEDFLLGSGTHNANRRGSGRDGGDGTGGVDYNGADGDHDDADGLDALIAEQHNTSTAAHQHDKSSGEEDDTTATTSKMKVSKSVSSHKPPRGPSSSSGRDSSKQSSKGATSGGSDDQPQQQQQQHLSITDRLLLQYRHQTAHQRELLQNAITHSGALVEAVVVAGTGGTRPTSASSAAVSKHERQQRRYDPEQRDVDDDEDDNDNEGDNITASTTKTMIRLADAAQGQTRLRSELRLAMIHHSEVAQVKLTDHWHEATEKLRERQLRAQQRKLELRERLSRPSAAYTAALETLSQESVRHNVNATTTPSSVPPTTTMTSPVPPVATAVVESQAPSSSLSSVLDRYRKDTDVFVADLKKEALRQQQALLQKDTAIASARCT